ncbi:GNAT family N-acetyltransferase [Thermodesulfobacteriota bacterium]
MEQVIGLRIRQMTEEDWESISEIDSNITGNPRSPTWPQRASSHLKTYSAEISFVAEVEGRVVGFILAGIRGAEYSLPLAGWIDIVGVDPEYHGQGIGRTLVEACFEECHLKGIKTRLMIKESDERLIKYLTSLGFQRGEFVEFVKGFTT